MRKKRLLLFPFALILAFAFAACGSTPPAEDPVTEQPVAQETPRPEGDADILRNTELRERVEGARQRAYDFESPAFFPSDWEDIDSRFNYAVNTIITSDEQRQQLTDELYGIADEYDALFSRTIPLYALSWEEDIMAARGTLIGTGLRDDYPEFLARADRIALAAMEQYEGEDYYTARDTAVDALAEYEALYVGARLILRRQEVIDRGFVHYDDEGFERADDLACIALDKFEEGEREEAAAAAEEAIAHFDQLMSSAWTSYAAERRTLTSAEREQAISNRANIAVRDLFRDAESVYNLAQENYAAGNHEDAAIFFLQSEALFAVALQETERRRNIAMETMRMAEERIELSEEAAAEAERILEGGAR